MIKKIAFLFPGQGSQFVGMGKDLYDNYDIAKNIYKNADSILGRSISDICFEGPEESLRNTVNTQPSIVTTSIAALEVLKSEIHISPDYVAGHSLGEYCAMYAAGVMDLNTTLSLIQKRANLMADAKSGSMAAVLNAPENIVKEGLDEGRKFGYVDIANFNSPVQIVITGEDEAVKKAGEYMLANGARRVVPLAVSGAFHSKFMSEAADEFQEYIKGFRFNIARIPVITNVDAEITTLADDFINKMPRQISSSVHWTQTIYKMAEHGVDTFIEIGPGKILTGLSKKIFPECNIHNIYDLDSLKNTVENLKSELAGV